jgi:hypothetical protein
MTRKSRLSHAIQRSGSNLFIREARDVSALTGVLDSDPANITVAIYVQQGVLVQVPGLCDFGWSKLNVKRVCVLKVLNFHGLNELSKKALCTVSRSGRSITRKYLPFISAIGAQQRIRPSRWIVSLTG